MEKETIILYINKVPHKIPINSVNEYIQFYIKMGYKIGLENKQ